MERLINIFCLLSLIFVVWFGLSFIEVAIFNIHDHEYFFLNLFNLLKMGGF